MKYKLAIFDMDGTILNTLEDLKNSLNYALSVCNFPSRTTQEVRRFVGNGIRLLVERGVPDYASELQTEKVFKLFNQHYALHCADNTRAYEGISALITEIQKNGIKTAVVSNKADYAVQSLCRQYFDGLFDAATGAKENVRKKPYPDLVNDVLKKLRIKSLDSVYIGDSEVDIETAKNAGMDCILVDWGFRSRKELSALYAGYIVSDVRELLEAITG